MYQKTRKQTLLVIIPTADAAVVIINPEDIRNIEVHLLALEDTTPHNHAKYILSGPEYITGQSIIRLVKQYADAKVEKTEFKITAWLGDLVKAGIYLEKLLPLILAGYDAL